MSKKDQTKISYKSVLFKVALFIVALLSSLILIFSINEKGYQQINEVISSYFKPDEKLKHLNQLRDEVTNLLNLQQVEIYFDRNKPSEKFLEETKRIDVHLDTLNQLMTDDSEQLEKIFAIDSLLESRRQVFTSYLALRYNYSLDINFKEKFGDINQILNRKVITKDTTTIEEEQKKKFKLFQSKKKKAEALAALTPKTKIEVKIDTFQIYKRDSVLNRIQRSIDKIQISQEKNKLEMKNQEILLINTNELIISEILSIIKQLENRQFELAKTNDHASKEMALEAIGRTKSILIFVSILSFILAVWIILDFIRIEKIKNQLEIAKKEAEFHSQAKQNFLANMSHEIRTPLQSIVGYSEILNKKYKDNGISTINNSSKHLLHIVNEILDYGKIISGKYSFSENSFNVEDLFNDAWTISLLHPKAKKLELVQDYQFDEIQLLGDDFRLKQILLNLINNAIKYTENGSVVLRAQSEINDENQVVLSFSITDTGIGIPAEKLDQIFEKYQQADEGHLTKGTGLGLSIVKELVEGQNGHIEVKSIEGQGSSFEVTITYGKSTETITQQSIISNQVSNEYLNGTIWFVEDDQIIQQLIKAHVNDFIENYRIFNDAEELLLEDISEIDCLVSDIRLTGKTGIELIKILRQNGFKKPIIAVTAQVLKEEHEEIYNAGFNGILVKPFTEKSLKDALIQFNPDLVIEKKQALNFSGLKELVNDSTAHQEIIQKFILATIQEIEYLKTLDPKNSLDDIHLLVHRISGRLLQIGSIEIGEKWRLLEHQIIDDSQSVTEKLLSYYYDELMNQLTNYK